MCYSGWHYAWNIIRGSSDLETLDCHRFYGFSGRIFVPVPGVGLGREVNQSQSAIGAPGHGYGALHIPAPPFCGQAAHVQERRSPRARTLDMEQQTTASSLGSNSRETTWGPKKTLSEFLTNSPRRSRDGVGRTGRPEVEMWLIGHRIPCGMGMSVTALSLRSLWVRCSLGQASLGNQQPQG